MHKEVGKLAVMDVPVVVGIVVTSFSQSSKSKKSLPLILLVLEHSITASLSSSLECGAHAGSIFSVVEYHYRGCTLELGRELE